VGGVLKILVTLCCVLAFSAHAQRALRVIVPFAAGGPVDLTTRWLMQEAQGPLSLAIVVENRAGAGGNIGMEALAKAPADGFTIGIATTASHALNPWLFSKLPYKPDSDFQAITQMLKVPNVLVLSKESSMRLKLQTVNDLITYARLHPGELNYGSAGNGSAGHLGAELLKSTAHLEITHIPFNGANPAQLALLSGQVDFNIDNLSSAAMGIKTGQLRALAVTSAQRSPLLPAVPTLAETLPGFEVETWWGLVAPKGVRAQWVNQLNQVFANILNSQDMKTKFASLMAEPQASSPEKFEAMMSAERNKYKHLVEISGAKVD
jgi:hypothetical protein